MAEPERTAALFVTCLVDLFRPAVAEATARLVRDADWTVAVPAQGCCGQPNSSSGDGAGAARLAALAIRRFARYARVVVPSASCAATIRGYPALFADGSAEQALARDLAARTRELTEFLDEQGAAPAPARWPARAAWHDSCSARRGLGRGPGPCARLAAVGGLDVRGLPSAEECCGFGGLFAARYPEVSARIADHKLDEIAASGADWIVGPDLGCLLHLEGRAQRRGLGARAVHVAEVLAGTAPGGAPGDD
jgi:L-lactate dehydrogenase complex protein LldE